MGAVVEEALVVRQEEHQPFIHLRVMVGHTGVEEVLGRLLLAIIAVSFIVLYSIREQAQLAQSESSGPVVLGHSHQQERQTNNGTLHTN